MCSSPLSFHFVISPCVAVVGQPGIGWIPVRKRRWQDKISPMWNRSEEEINYSDSNLFGIFMYINTFRTTIKDKAFVIDMKTDTKIFIPWKDLSEFLFCVIFFTTIRQSTGPDLGPIWQRSSLLGARKLAPKKTFSCEKQTCICHKKTLIYIKVSLLQFSGSLSCK